MNGIANFLSFCAGVYRPVLKRCPSDTNKFIGIGGTVLFTAHFAGLAAGYALYTVFDHLLIAIVLAVVWAAAIFNLDRYIVGTMRKNGNSRSEFKLAVPRLMLAVILALVIAKPLELRIFEKEINQQLATKKLRLIQETKQALDANYPEIVGLDQQISALKDEINQTRQFRNEKQQEYDAERFGVKTPGTSGRAGIGINARKKEEQLDEAQTAYRETERLNRAKIDLLESEKNRLNGLKEADLQYQEERISQMNGLAARLQAMGDLENEHPTIGIAGLFIVLLFALLETSPILVKWMAPRGPYDALLAFRENAQILHTENQWYQVQAESVQTRELFDLKLAKQASEQRNQPATNDLAIQE
jgi:hypothetical protein